MTERKALTVTELWERLAACPPDAEIWIDDSNRHFAAPIVDSLATFAAIDGKVYLFPGD